MESQTKIKLYIIHRKIDALWRELRQRKGYKEWINADVGCFFVKLQMEIIIELMYSIERENNLLVPRQPFASLTDRKSCIADFDFLYNTMFELWNQLVLNENVNNLFAFNSKQWHSVLYEKNIFYKNLLRMSYVIFM